MNNTPSDFRTALDMDMAAKGLNERTLGDKLGVSQQSISKWRKRNFPPLYRLDQLREILGADSYVARMDFAQMVMEVPRTRLVAPSNVAVPAAFTKTRLRIIPPATPEGAAWGAAIPQAASLTSNLNDGFREWRIAQEARFYNTLPYRLAKNQGQHYGYKTLRVGPKEAPVEFDYLSDRLALEVKYIRKFPNPLTVQANESLCFQLLAATKWQREQHGIDLKPVLALIEMEMDEDDPRFSSEIQHSRIRHHERAKAKFDAFCEVLGITVLTFTDTLRLAEYIADAEGVEMDPNVYADECQLSLESSPGDD